MADAKYTIDLDFKGKDELNNIVTKLLQRYNLDVNANLGSIQAEIERKVISPAQKAKNAFAEWGLVIGGIQGSFNQVSAVFDKTIGAVIKASGEAQAAGIRLEGALRASGLEVEANTARLSKYASQLQKTTVHEDDMLRVQMAQLQNIAQFGDVSQLERATKAAIGLSQALGIDLGTSMDMMGKAAQGNFTMWGRYGIVLDESASASEKFNQLLYKGLDFFPLAEDYARSQIGSLEQLKNVWGDFQETLGEGVLPVVKALTDTLKPLIEFATAMSAEQKALTLGLIILNALVVKHTLAIMSQKAAFAALSLEQQKQVGTLMVLMAAQKGGAVGTLSFSTAMKGLGASLVAAGTAVKGFLASMGPVGWVILGVTTAFAGLSAIIGAKNKAEEKSIENQKKINEGKQENIERTRSEAESTLRLTSRYEELSKKAKKTSKDQEEMRSIFDQIKGKYPGLISSTDDYRNALDSMGLAADRARADLEKLAQQSIDLARAQARVNVMESRRAALDAKSGVLSFIQDIGAAVTGIFGSSISNVQSQLISLGTALRRDDVAGVRLWMSAIDGNTGVFTRVQQERWAIMRLSVENYLRAINDLSQVGAMRISSTANDESPETGGSEGTDESDIDRRLSEYRALRAAGFIEKAREEAEVRARYENEIISSSGQRKIDLEQLMNYELAQITKKYRIEEEERDKQHYDQLKFYDTGYYEWKSEQLRLQSYKLFHDQEDLRGAWLADQMDALDAEKAVWENRPIREFEAAYDAEMSHLSELKELGLATYGEIASKSWEYYRALQAIVSADGEVSEAEQELLNVYLARAQAAQLQANSDSDISNYYNEMMFADESYYEWKRARIVKDVNDMDIAEDQRAELLKKRLGELDDDLHTYNKDLSLVSYMLGDMGFDESDRKGIIESYSMLADQISGIWQQLYSNIDASRQASLEKLERRAKEERRSEAWLASEKDKINAEYDKKARQMKRAEKFMQIASASMNTAEGVTNALTLKPAWMAPIMAAAVGSLGLYQVKLIADQKLAGGGVVNPGLFRGRGSSTSDSNLIAISDNEYIVSARRVRELGLPLLDALNFGDGETVRKALASLNYSLNHSALIQAPAAPNRSGAYSSGGAVVGASGGRAFTQKIVLVCDNREIARAVVKGNKRLLTT
jgi:hypothetical protein